MSQIGARLEAKQPQLGGETTATQKIGAGAIAAVGHYQDIILLPKNVTLESEPFSPTPAHHTPEPLLCHSRESIDLPNHFQARPRLDYSQSFVATHH